VKQRHLQLHALQGIELIGRVRDRLIRRDTRLRNDAKIWVDDFLLSLIQFGMITTPAKLLRGLSGKRDISFLRCCLKGRDRVRERARETERETETGQEKETERQRETECEREILPF
jgi:hypothetical protein